MRRAPRLVARALLASFGTVAVILVAVFVLISLDVRARVRESVFANLDAGQQVAARVEALRHRDLLQMVSLLAENPTLKAALDTWQTERDTMGDNQAALNTVQHEADKLARRLDTDVLALLDVEGTIVASAGRLAAAWRAGTQLRARDGDDASEFVAEMPSGTFRVRGVALRFGDAVIGSIELGRVIDDEYARELAGLVRGHSVVLIGNRTVATTLPPAAAAELPSLTLPFAPPSSLVTLAGESYALRHVYDVPPARFFTLASVDGAARKATVDALSGLLWIGVAGIGLAAVGSLGLAHALTRPIDQLSASVSAMTLARRFDTPLPATGTSRELDALAETFNALIRAVSDAEAETQAAYLGAIRALAAALDARDPYTAGHSERVSALAVAIGQAMSLSPQELDTLRLGALLHDIGKIGVPDHVLGKPSALTAAEFELIRAHPVVGARILRSIPFLAAHLPIVELHHERPDGKGYPYGLCGDAIPLAAHIVHVADAYDAMTSRRAYRPERSPQEAIAELVRNSGADFHGPCVQALIAALAEEPGFEGSSVPALEGSLVQGFDGPKVQEFEGARVRRLASASRRAMLGALLLALPASAAAQPSRVALDVVSAVDGVQGSTPRRDTAVWFDVFSAVRVADGLEVIARPVISRRTFDGSWQKQLYQLGVRYEHGASRQGGLGWRLEAGQMPSPIGIGMLENRADLNPVVSQHSAYYLPLPRVDPEIPRTFLIAGAYPFGAQATLSARTWDVRVAAIDSSPVRGRSFFGSSQTPRLLNVVAGAGITPHVGLRVGAAVAHGAYASVNEVVDRTRGDRDATMVQVEGEWAFGHTRIVGEWVRSVMETARADARTAGFWIEATQTLTPRVFVAGRADSQAFDYQRPGRDVLERQRYERFEAIGGFRLTRELTLRGGYLVRHGYVVSHWDDQVIGSIVWQRRLW